MQGREAELRARLDQSAVLRRKLLQLGGVGTELREHEVAKPVSNARVFHKLSATKRAARRVGGETLSLRLFDCRGPLGLLLGG
jgi:hypothetical protein